MLSSINFTKEFAFLKLVENLKMELRHSWLSNGRRESVADHIFRLSLMVMRYAECLDQPIDIFKSVKMAIVHDLAEAMVGDVPVLEAQTVEAKKRKNDAELQAMQQLKVQMSDANFDEMYDLMALRALHLSLLITLHSTTQYFLTFHFERIDDKHRAVLEPPKYPWVMFLK